MTSLLAHSGGAVELFVLGAAIVVFGLAWLHTRGGRDAD
jgi:hypothetical protein